MDSKRASFFERIRETFAAFLGERRRVPRASGPSQDTRGRARPAPEPRGEPTEEDLLRDRLLEKGHLAAGGIQVIGLGRVQERLGDRWPHFAEKAHNTARKIIERRLTPVDVFAQYGDGYVLVFGELPREAAELKCAIMAEEIVRTLVGEEAAARTIEVKSVVVEVDGTLLTKDIGILESIAGLLEDSAPAGAPQSAQGRPDVERSTPAGAAEDAAAAVDVPPQELGFVYRPIWDVRLEAVLTSHCLPARHLPERNAWVTGHAALAPATRAQRAHLDLTVLRRMRDDLEALSRRGRRQPLACSIHLDSLTRPSSWEAIMDICQTIPEPLRAYAIFEIVGIPNSTPQVRLFSLIPALRPFCRSLVARARLDQSRFVNFHYLAIDVISADLSSHPGPETEAATAMQAFVRGAKGAGFRSAIHGVPTIGLAAKAVSAGFDFIDGDAIHPVSQVLEPARRLRFADLSAHLRRPPRPA